MENELGEVYHTLGESQNKLAEYNLLMELVGPGNILIELDSFEENQISWNSLSYPGFDHAMRVHLIAVIIGKWGGVLTITVHPEKQNMEGGIIKRQIVRNWPKQP